LVNGGDAAFRPFRLFDPTVGTAAIA